MEKSFKITIKLLIFCVILVSFTFFFKENLYKYLIKEDGIIEYLTCLLLLIASVLLFWKVIKIKFCKGHKWFYFNLLMALGLFFGFGEEISWGQRIFSIPSNDFFIKYNSQNETNIHNFIVADVKINKLIFSYCFSVIFGIYFLFLYFLYKKSNHIKNIVDKFGIPVPKVKHSATFILSSVAAVSFISDGKKWELWECLFALFFLLILTDPYNHNEKLLLEK